MSSGINPFPCFTYKEGKMVRGVKIDGEDGWRYAYVISPCGLQGAFGDDDFCSHALVAVDSDVWVGHDESMFWVGDVRHYLLHRGGTLTITEKPVSTVLYVNGSEHKHHLPEKERTFLFDGASLTEPPQGTTWAITEIPGRVYMDPAASFVIQWSK